MGEILKGEALVKERPDCGEEMEEVPDASGDWVRCPECLHVEKKEG